MSPWFGQVDLGEAQPAHQRVVQAVSDLLDQLRPLRLDPAQQVVEINGGETWLNLQHDSEPELEIRLVLCGQWANFYGVMGHDEAYSDSHEPVDAWEFETVDILADLLQAPYTFDVYEIGGKRWREVLTIGEPYYNMVINRGPTPAALLPLRKWATLVHSRRASFDCSGIRPSNRRSEAR